MPSGEQSARVDVGEITVGGLWGGEDVWHRPVGTDSAYRESYYFDFVNDAGCSGFTSVGWKPGRGALGVTTVVFAPDGAWLAQQQRATTGDFPVLEVGGLSYRRSADTFGSWDIAMDAPMTRVEEIGTVSVTGTAPSEARAELAFSYRPVGPEVLSTGGAYDRAFTWHLDQPGRSMGHVRVGGGPVRSFDSHGHRDRSFGPRDWTYFDSWLYLVGHTDEADLNVWALQRPDGTWAATGWLRRDGEEVEVIERYRVAPTDFLHVGEDRVPAVLEFRLAGKRSALEGRAESARLVQLGFATRRGRARLDRGVGVYRIDGHSGIGQVEYQQRIGRPDPHQAWRLGDW